MNVHLFVVGSVDLDFIPRYVVPVCILLGLAYFAYDLLLCHRYHKNLRELEEPGNTVQPEGDVLDVATPVDESWKYPCFFECHPHDSSRLRIDTKVIGGLVGEDLKRLTDDERWFVEWYHNERKKGLTHWSVSGSLSLPDVSQDDVCKELRAMLTAPTLEDKEIF